MWARNVYSNAAAEHYQTKRNKQNTISYQIKECIFIHGRY